MIKVSRTIVPSFFTVGNMFCGYMSVIFAVFNNNLITASWMIVLAAILDALDGKVARFTKTSSKFGVEYDSLADVVSFGLAPSVLIYTYFFSTWGSVGVFISFFPLLFASIRLARFNVHLDGFDKNHFTGLPSPAAANSFAAYLIFMFEVFPGLIQPKILVVLTFFISFLMVSTIRYDIMPSISPTGTKKEKVLFFSSIAAIILLIAFPQILFLLYIILYVLSGIVRYLFRIGNTPIAKS
ncbi:MAG: CDP-diacylglycerol--serine O-phosphatidyltransferase [Ignavibacteria bacterium]|nr:CDP-diacylglycerol--serine O-phosphatidyltransferase [Ignavibacteria bacterium]